MRTGHLLMDAYPPMKKPLPVRDRFSAAAETYDRHASVQRRVANELATRFPADRTTTPILEIGCGTGLLTERLLEAFPESRLDILDLSSRMLQQARKNLDDPPGIEWMVADICEFDSPHRYAFITSSAALHWASSIPRAFANIRRHLAPGGQAALSLMLDGTLKELREARAHIAPEKTAPGNLPSGSYVLEAFRQAGCAVRRHSEQTYIQHYPSARDFFRALHQQGLTGGPLAQAQRPLTRSQLERLASYYQDHYQEANTVRATYQVGFFQIEGC